MYVECYGLSIYVAWNGGFPAMHIETGDGDKVRPVIGVFLNGVEIHRIFDESADCRDGGPLRGG